MLRIVFAYNWEIRNTRNGEWKSILPCRTRGKMGTREERGVRRDSTLVERAIRMQGVLGQGRGEMVRKFGSQNFVEMNVENLK